MATLTPGYTFTSGEVVTPTKLNLLGTPTAAVTNNEVTTAKIADANVTTAKIADANVTTAKIADANVTTAKIADGSITASKLAGNVDQLATAWVLFDGDIADSAVAGAVFTRLTSTRVKVTRSTGHGLSNGNWITFMPSSTVTISVANPALITWTGHALAVGQTVTFSTTGTLPTGLIAGTTYFVKAVTAGTTFQVSLTSGGTAIATTAAGSGVHTARLTGGSDPFGVFSGFYAFLNGTWEVQNATATEFEFEISGATTPTNAVTFTENSANISWPSHALVVGQTVILGAYSPLNFILPTPFAENTTYFVKAVSAGTFQVSLTSTGTAIVATNLGSGGSGSHFATLTGVMTSQIFSPVAIKRKYNISKIARTGLGIYRVYFATPPLTVDYISLGSAASTSGAAVGLVGSTTQTLAYAQIITTNYAGTAANFDGIRFVVFGG